MDKIRLVSVIIIMAPAWIIGPAVAFRRTCTLGRAAVAVHVSAIQFVLLENLPPAQAAGA